MKGMEFVTHSLLEVNDRSWAMIVALPEGETGHRLEALGLRPGKKIERISAMPFHGPVTLSLDGRQIAIGREIAGHLQVQELEG